MRSASDGSADVGGLVDRALDAIAAGGVLPLAVLMAVENLFPPIPSEAVLPLAGFAVSAGRLSLAGALAASTLGSVVGAWVLYGAARYGGRPLLYRFEWLLRVTDADLDRADAWFDRRGPAIVFWARMVPFARSVVSIPAGLSEMPFGRFTLLTTGGTLIWNALLIAAGWALGERWEAVAAAVDVYAWVVIAGLVAGTTLLVWHLRRRRRRRRQAR